MLLEVFLEGAELELHRGVCKIQQAIWHVDVIEGAGQSHNGRIVAEVDGDTLRMRRWWTTRRIGSGRLLAAVAMRIVGIVTGMIGPDAE